MGDAAFSPPHNSASHTIENKISMDFDAKLHSKKPEKLQNEPKKGF